MSDLIWQPKGVVASLDYNLILARDIASQLLQRDILEEERNLVVNKGKFILNRQKYNKNDPFRFYQGSSLIERIDLDVGNGIWIAANVTAFEGTQTSNLTYYSHNVGRHEQMYTLQALFESWITFFERRLIVNRK